METNLLVRLIEKCWMHIIENAAESLVRKHGVEQFHTFVIFHGETAHDQHVAARLRYILQELLNCGPMLAVAIIDGRIFCIFIQTEILQHGRFKRTDRITADNTETRFVHIANGDGRKW